MLAAMWSAQEFLSTYTKTVAANQVVAEYTGIPVFRIKDGDERFIVFRKDQDEPFYEQLTSDKCVAWSNICCHGIEFGIENIDGLGVSIAHSKHRNVEIHTSYVTQYKDPRDGKMHDVVNDGEIRTMRGFSKFMAAAEMSVVAIKRVAMFHQLRMDYAPGCQKLDLNKNWVSPESERAKEIIKEKLHLHDEYAKAEGIESYWKPRSDLSPEIHNFKMRWKEFLKDKSSLGMEQIKTFYDACDEKNQRLLKELAKFLVAGHTTRQATQSVVNLANTNDKSALAFLLGMRHFLLLDERAVNVSDQEWLELSVFPSESLSSLKRSHSASISEEESVKGAKMVRESV
ncbi:hypothetical protein GCM10023116_32060 [Kistimonas scapharcae]|uniref:Uncharacterized protein n=2 Tax=Kistimonas scapharcae TaxID=1036133 RepID=A0ABP8V3X7_9GAMM